MISPAIDCDLYANTTGLPCEEDFVWKGEAGATQFEKTILIRPQDPNYRDTKYYATIITTAKPADFTLTISVTPYAPTLREGAEKLRASRERARQDSFIGQSRPQAEMGIHLQKEDAAAAGKVLNAILAFSEDRKRKGAMGARVPPKNELNVLRPRGQTETSGSRGASPHHRGASRGGSPPGHGGSRSPEGFGSAGKKGSLRAIHAEAQVRLKSEAGSSRLLSSASSAKLGEASSQGGAVGSSGTHAKPERMRLGSAAHLGKPV